MADIGPRLEAVLSSIATADVRAEVPPIKYAQWLSGPDEYKGLES